MEQFCLKVLVALVPPLVLSMANNHRLHQVKLQNSTAHLGREMNENSLGSAKEGICTWKKEKLSACPFLTLKIESPRLAALSAGCFLTFRVSGAFPGSTSVVVANNATSAANISASVSLIITSQYSQYTGRAAVVLSASSDEEYFN